MPRIAASLLVSFMYKITKLHCMSNSVLQIVLPACHDENAVYGLSNFCILRATCRDFDAKLSLYIYQK